LARANQLRQKIGFRVFETLGFETLSLGFKGFTGVQQFQSGSPLLEMSASMRLNSLRLKNSFFFENFLWA
jgi:hypothetical protein